jgi:hypothetical protein
VIKGRVFKTARIMGLATGVKENVLLLLFFDKVFTQYATTRQVAGN